MIEAALGERESAIATLEAVLEENGAQPFPERAQAEQLLAELRG